MSLSKPLGKLPKGKLRLLDHPDRDGWIITTGERELDEKAPIAQIDGGYAEPFESEQHAYAKLLCASKDLAAALQAIVQFCDDPEGSRKPESLAEGLSRMLPNARSALARAGVGP